MLQIRTAQYIPFQHIEYTRLGTSKTSVATFILEIVFTRAAPAFDNLFMGCVFNINTVHKTGEKLTFQAFY